jgi:hypothetical protein
MRYSIVERFREQLEGRTTVNQIYVQDLAFHIFLPCSEVCL